MATRGLHPYSDYATSEGNMIYAMSSLDIIIDIAGIYFPLRSLSYKKNMNISDEHGTGSLDPYALVNQEQTYSGSFTYASFLVSGEKALNDSESLILHSLLEDADDEGRAKYFDIILMEAAGNSQSKLGDRSRPKHDQGNVDSAKAGALKTGFIEALINCKLTTSGREYPEKGTIVTSYDFKFSRRIPR
jgi:hypothetical protein